MERSNLTKLLKLDFGSCLFDEQDQDRPAIRTIHAINIAIITLSDIVPSVAWWRSYGVALKNHWQFDCDGPCATAPVSNCHLVAFCLPAFLLGGAVSGMMDRTLGYLVKPTGW